MRLNDTVRFSIRNALKSKSRTFITLLLSLILSFFTLFFVCLMISYNTESTKAMGELYFGDNKGIAVYYKDDFAYTRGLRDEYEHFAKDDIETFDNAIKKSEESVSYVTFEGNAAYFSISLRQFENNPYDSNIQYERTYWMGGKELLVDSAHLINKGYKIIEGNNLSSEANHVLISSTVAKELINQGYTLEMGKELDSGYYSKNVFNPYPIVVDGIYELTEDEVSIDGINKRYIREGYDVILDYRTFLNLPNYENTSQMRIVSSEVIYISEDTINYKIDGISKLYDTLVEAFPKIRIMPSAPGAKPYTVEYISSNFLKDYKSISKNQIYILIGGITASLFFSVFSIYSLTNTLAISIKKSKKTYGLLMALGAKGKEVKRIALIESLLIIILGTILGYLLIFALSPLLNNVIYMVLKSTFGFSFSNINYHAHFATPIYVLPIVLLVYIVFTLVFTHSSLNKLANANPIEVINEAN